MSLLVRYLIPETKRKKPIGIRRGEREKSKAGGAHSSKNLIGTTKHTKKQE
jgi:hypothetical protein